jgi:hypothetical protein
VRNAAVATDHEAQLYGACGHALARDGLFVAEPQAPEVLAEDPAHDLRRELATHVKGT